MPHATGSPECVRDSPVESATDRLVLPGRRPTVCKFGGNLPPIHLWFSGRPSLLPGPVPCRRAANSPLGDLVGEGPQPRTLHTARAPLRPEKATVQKRRTVRRMIINSTILSRVLEALSKPGRSIHIAFTSLVYTRQVVWNRRTCLFWTPVLLIPFVSSSPHPLRPTPRRRPGHPPRPAGSTRSTTTSSLWPVGRIPSAPT